MKIVHIAPNSPYNDYWGYQDNLLPKYQKKLGHDVTVLVSNKEHDNGQIVEGLAREYDLSDGQHIVRIPYKRYLTDMLTNLHSYMPVYHKLVEFHPDFIFFHGLVSDSIFDAIRYKENVNPDCVIVQDNHADYNIGNASDTLKRKYCGIIIGERIRNQSSMLTKCMALHHGGKHMQKITIRYLQARRMC